MRSADYALRLDGDSNAFVSDREGTMSGYKAASIVNDFPYFKSKACVVSTPRLPSWDWADNSSSKERPDWTAAVCPHRFANVWIENLASDKCGSSPALKDILKVGLTFRAKRTLLIEACVRIARNVPGARPARER